MRKGLWILALAGALTAPAYAQLPRQLPANGKLAELAGTQQPYPLVQLGSKARRLAPGARIIDENNRTIVHSYLPEHASVLYVEDMSGDVSRIFILRPDELEQLKRAR